MQMPKASRVHEGNLIIRNAADAEKYQNITKVTGYLSINASAKLDALKSVGGYLYINASAKLDAPLLESVGGYLYINASAKLDALKSVGGDLYINEKTELTAGKLYCGGYKKFKIIDNIGCVVLSSKQSNGVTVLLCRHSKIKNQKVVGDKFYVAQRGGNNAHGKTVAEATQELLFKTGSRDVSQYRNMGRDTAKTPAEWAIVYRMITGACQYGTNKFIESHRTLKKKYKLSEIVSLTKGQYGHEKFVDVVSGPTETA